MTGNRIGDEANSAITLAKKLQANQLQQQLNAAQEQTRRLALAGEPLASHPEKVQQRDIAETSPDKQVVVNQLTSVLGGGSLQLRKVKQQVHVETKAPEPQDMRNELQVHLSQVRLASPPMSPSTASASSAPTPKPSAHQNGRIDDQV